MHAKLPPDTSEGGVFPQISCNLSAVFNRKQTKVAEALLKHEVVGLSDLFGGGPEGDLGMCEAMFGKDGINAILVAFFGGLCLGKVSGNGLTLGRGDGRHGRLMNLSRCRFVLSITV